MNDDAQTNGENMEPLTPQPEQEESRTSQEEKVQESEMESEAGTKPEKDVEPEIGTKPKVEPEAAPKPVKRAPSFWSRALRWTLGFLIVFGLGFIAAVFLFYIPTRQQSNTLQSNLQTANQQATQSAIDSLQQATQSANTNQQKISDLQNQVQQLSALESKNKELQTELDQAKLHIAILSARTDVATAQLALEKQDTSKAHVSISQTPDTLDSMSSMLASNQQNLVEDMKARLQLADSEIDNNAFAAQSDLTVLATSLLELENAIFTKP